MSAPKILASFAIPKPNSGGGTVWTEGSGVPSDAVGSNGDFYLNTANGDVYFKATGTYTVIYNIHGTNGTNGTNGTGGTNGTNGTGGANGLPSVCVLGHVALYGTGGPPVSNGQIVITDSGGGFSPHFDAVALITVRGSDDNGVDVSTYLSNIHIGDYVELFYRNDSTHYGIYQVAGVGAGSGNYQFTVNPIAGTSNAMTNGSLLGFSVTKNGTNGTDGAPGTNGTNGTNGTDGTNGSNGTNGTDGTAGDPTAFTGTGSFTTFTISNGLVRSAF